MTRGGTSSRRNFLHHAIPIVMLLGPVPQLHSVHNCANICNTKAPTLFLDQGQHRRSGCTILTSHHWRYSKCSFFRSEAQIISPANPEKESDSEWSCWKVMEIVVNASLWFGTLQCCRKIQNSSRFRIISAYSWWNLNKFRMTAVLHLVALLFLFMLLSRINAFREFHSQVQCLPSDTSATIGLE